MPGQRQLRIAALFLWRRPGRGGLDSQFLSLVSIGYGFRPVRNSSSPKRHSNAFRALAGRQSSPTSRATSRSLNRNLGRGSGKPPPSSAWPIKARWPVTTGTAQPPAWKQARRTMHIGAGWRRRWLVGEPRCRLRRDPLCVEFQLPDASCGNDVTIGTDFCLRRTQFVNRLKQACIRLRLCDIHMFQSFPETQTKAWLFTASGK